MLVVSVCVCGYLCLFKLVFYCILFYLWAEFGHIFVDVWGRGHYLIHVGVSLCRYVRHCACMCVACVCVCVLSERAAGLRLKVYHQLIVLFLLCLSAGRG